MPTILHPYKPTSHRTHAHVAEDFRTPHYECQENGQAMDLELYVPGVEASGVEIAQRGPDLIITAAKAHPLRVNFRAAHFEACQHNYRLCLRLGSGFDLSRLTGEVEAGVLRLRLPKKARAALASATAERRVA